MAPNGYNLAKGGKGTPGHAHSEESKQKMREAGTGRILPTEWRESISAALTGVKKSEEHAAKVGLAHRGKKLSEEQKQTLRIINTGKTLSEETKSKISAIGKGRRHSEESIEKMKINRALSSGKNFMCIETGEVFFSQRIAAEKLGVKQGHISSVLSGRRKHTKGFTFQYIETTVEGDANVGYE